MDNQPIQSVLEDINFKPKISINNVEIKSISLKNIILKSNISITNLFPLDIYIKDAMVNIYYQDKIINSYKIKGQNLLKARSKNDINLDSDIKINDLVKMIDNYTKLDSLPFKLEVITDIILPNFDKQNLMEYSLREKFDINIPTFNPKITMKGINFSLSNIKVIFNLKNQTSAKIHLSNINYLLNLNGIEFNGIATAITQQDNSIDIVLDKLQNSLNLKDSKNISLILNLKAKIDDFPYNIPININKTF